MDRRGGVRSGTVLYTLDWPISVVRRDYAERWSGGKMLASSSLRLPPLGRPVWCTILHWVGYEYRGETKDATGRHGLLAPVRFKR